MNESIAESKSETDGNVKEQKDENIHTHDEIGDKSTEPDESIDGSGAKSDTIEREKIDGGFIDRIQIFMKNAEIESFKGYFTASALVLIIAAIFLAPLSTIFQKFGIALVFILIVGLSFSGFFSAKPAHGLVKTRENKSYTPESTETRVSKENQISSRTAIPSGSNNDVPDESRYFSQNKQFVRSEIVDILGKDTMESLQQFDAMKLSKSIQCIESSIEKTGEQLAEDSEKISEASTLYDKFETVLDSRIDTISNALNDISSNPVFSSDLSPLGKIETISKDLDELNSQIVEIKDTIANLDVVPTTQYSVNRPVGVSQTSRNQDMQSDGASTNSSRVSSRSTKEKTPRGSREKADIAQSGANSKNPIGATRSNAKTKPRKALRSHKAQYSKKRSKARDKNTSNKSSEPSEPNKKLTQSPETPSSASIKVGNETVRVVQVDNIEKNIIVGGKPYRQQRNWFRKNPADLKGKIKKLLRAKYEPLICYAPGGDLYYVYYKA